MEYIVAAQIRSHIDSNDLGNTFQAITLDTGNCPVVYSEGDTLVVIQGHVHGPGPPQAIGYLQHD